MTNWIKRYLDLAHHIAQWSKDPSTKVGAVIIGPHRRQIALGYNGFPEGIIDDPRRLNDRDIKIRLMQHAERNALDQATFDLFGSTLVVTHHPCSECAKSIVSKGIIQVYCPLGSPGYRLRWADEMRWSRLILNEANVILTEVDDDGKAIENPAALPGEQVEPANDPS
jgi:dCMP deaminase